MSEIRSLTSPNKKVLQVIKQDGSYTIEYYKSLIDIGKKYDLPYNKLVNIYYICIQKGGGVKKDVKKRYIHHDNIALLNKIRIFDNYNFNEMSNDREYFESLIHNVK
jgi:hypothetical protein